MNENIKALIKKIFFPIYISYKKIKDLYWSRHYILLVDKLYFQRLGKRMNWKNPIDLNEKINWLKFHEDPILWANLADKYKVRDYVSSRGLESILLPIYGVWNSVADVINDWDSLPDEFVLKSNNGCGRVLIISKDNGGKASIDREQLREQLKEWLLENDYGIKDGELHYQYIKNCIFAEKLIDKISRSIEGHKIVPSAL